MYTFANKNQVMTLRDVLAGRAKTKEGEQPTGASSNDRPSYYKIPPTPVTKEMDADSIIKLVQTIPGMRTLVQTPIRLPATTPLAQGKLVNYTYGKIEVGASHYLHDFILNSKTLTAERKKVICDKVNTHLSTNNTVKAVLTRIKEKLPGVPPSFSPTESQSAIISSIFIFDSAKLLNSLKKFAEHPDDYFSDELQDEFPKFYNVMKKADAGMPFMAFDKKAKCGDPEVAEKAIALAKHYFKLLDSPTKKAMEDIGAYFRQPDHALETLFMLKRKTEVISRSDLDKKVRPYVVMPLGLKTIFKICGGIVKGALKNFTQDPNSISAVGFSWAYGGAQRLVDWIFADVGTVTGKPRFRATAFGDDNLWVITYKDGTVMLLCPDFIAMDMNLPSISAAMVYNLAWGIAEKLSANVPLVIRNAALLASHFAFQSSTLVSGSVCVLKQWGLFSGVPMTTVYDVMGSAMAVSVVKPLFERGDMVYSKSDFLKTCATAILLVEKKCGMRIKPETMTPEELHEDSTVEINSPFLSMKMSKALPVSKGAWIPVPVDVDMFFVRSVWPTYAPPKGTATRVAVGRVFGQYVSGGYTDKDFASYVSDVWTEVSLKSHLTPLFDGDIGFIGEDLEDIYNISHAKLPTPEEMASLYTTTPEAFSDQFVYTSRVGVEGPSESSVLDLVYLATSSLPMSLGAHKAIKAKHVGGHLPKPKPAPKQPAPKKVALRKDTKKGSKHIDVLDFSDLGALPDDDSEEEEIVVAPGLERVIEDMERKLDEERIEDEDEEIDYEDDFIDEEDIDATDMYNIMTGMGINSRDA